MRAPLVTATIGRLPEPSDPGDPGTTPAAPVATGDPVVDAIVALTVVITRLTDEIDLLLNKKFT